jgi:hypothetical protein
LASIFLKKDKSVLHYFFKPSKYIINVNQFILINLKRLHIVSSLYVYYFFYAKIDFKASFIYLTRLHFLQTSFSSSLRLYQEFLRSIFTNNTGTPIQISFGPSPSTKNRTSDHFLLVIQMLSTKKATERSILKLMSQETCKCCSTNHVSAATFFNSSSDRNCETGIPYKMLVNGI